METADRVRRAACSASVAWAVVAILCCGTVMRARAGTQGGESTSMPARSEVLRRLPLAFVENLGQWDTSANFVAKRGGMTARIERDGLVLDLSRRVDGDRLDGVVIRLAFQGAL